MPKPKAENDRIVSAQVILRSKSGRTIPGDVPITSANLAQYTPSPEDVVTAQRIVRDAGFDVASMVGISFAIIAPLGRFEHFFKTKLRIGKGGEVAPEGHEAPSGGLELPLTHVPADLAARISAVVFTPPAELYGKEGSALF